MDSDAKADHAKKLTRLLFLFNATARLIKQSRRSSGESRELAFLSARSLAEALAEIEEMKNEPVLAPCPLVAAGL
jgi:hypothetical protein